MPWIESHQKLEKHPKLLELCSKTGWNKDETIGKLHRLWWWVLDYAEDGILTRFTPEQCLSEINGKIPPKDLLQVLIDTNFVDKDLKIHDWWDYAGRYLTAKYRNTNPKLLQKIEKKYRATKSRTKVSLKTDNQPTNLNLPNQDNLIISAQADGLLKQFTSTLQEKIKVYIERNRLKNKSKVLTEGRKVTLLTELWNTKERCVDDSLFGYAVDMAIQYAAENIGYINAIIKNKMVGKV